jgi:gluconate 2-dehydrogenase gamma chain
MGDYVNDTLTRLFFNEHEWETVKAAAARIIPTDRDPGATEAGSVRFIDRYLSGIEYVYANPWGSGFLRLEGRRAAAWQKRINRLQDRYLDGLKQMDEVSRGMFGKDFVDLSGDEQDEVLVDLSPKGEKPKHVNLFEPSGEDTEAEEGGDETVILLSQPVTDENLDFFGTLVIHTRMGFYCDPAYGGNENHVGWKTIGFPGPASLIETTDGRYSTMEYTEPWPSFAPSAPDEASK